MIRLSHRYNIRDITVSESIVFHTLHKLIMKIKVKEQRWALSCDVTLQANRQRRIECSVAVGEGLLCPKEGVHGGNPFLGSMVVGRSVCLRKTEQEKDSIYRV